MMQPYLDEWGDDSAATDEVANEGKAGTITKLARHRGQRCYTVDFQPAEDEQIVYYELSLKKVSKEVAESKLLMI
jgi:hypothetical protein